MTKDEFYATVTPALLNFLAVAVPAILGYIAYVIRGWVAKVTEGKDREALHSAIRTAVSNARAKFGPAVTNEQVLGSANDYLPKSVPDALENLTPPTDVVSKLALAENERQANQEIAPHA